MTFLTNTHLHLRTDKFVMHERICQVADVHSSSICFYTLRINTLSAYSFVII